MRKYRSVCWSINMGIGEKILLIHLKHIVEIKLFMEIISKR